MVTAFLMSFCIVFLWSCEMATSKWVGHSFTLFHITKQYFIPLHEVLYDFSFAFGCMVDCGGLENHGCEVSQDFVR